jgi:hypothetical protein
VNHWRQLPIPLAPARQETLASWLHRLATVHGLRSSDLRQHLRLGPRSIDAEQLPSLAHRLAAVTGHPVARLARALPELRMPAPHWPGLRHLAQHACPQCTARHQGGPVRRLFAHHEYLCTRHGYWTGPPDPVRDDPPPHLAGQLPELVAAQHRLRRITLRHGWTATFDATAAATSICIDLRFSATHHPLWTRWQQRLDLLMPTGYQRSVFMAAIYPEVAALAGVLATPAWRTAAVAGSPAAGRLLHAAQQALRCTEPASHHDISHALMTWTATRAAGPLLQPASTYPQTMHHDDGTPQVTDVQRLAEQRTAHRFSRDRRAPRTYPPAAAMPYAHRPAKTTAIPAGRPT